MHKRSKASNPRVPRAGAPVVYDANAHAAFVTGFRKRKQARRLEAEQAAKRAEKEVRRIERNERRSFFREASARARAFVAHEEGEEELEEEKEGEKCVYERGDTVVTTDVTPITCDKDTSFVKSVLAPVSETYSRQNPLPKDLSVHKESGAEKAAGKTLSKKKGAKGSRAGLKGAIRKTRTKQGMKPSKSRASKRKG